MSIKQRLNRESGQVPVLVEHAAHARFVWNLALEQANCYRREQGPTPNTAARMRQLTEAREASEWLRLRLGSSAVQQAALRDFDQAMKNWWGHTHRRPTWRKASRHNSFVVRDLTVARINRKWATVLIPKLGHVRFRLTRPFTDVAAASSARVSVDRSGRWWVSFTCPPPTFDRAHTGKSVGVDRGCANSIATSEGVMAHAPGFTVGEQARFLALQRRKARQVKNSGRYTLTRAKIARMYATLGDRRRDWVEHTSTALVRGYDVVAIEDLHIPNMVRKPKPKLDPEIPGAYLPNSARAKAALSKAILASCWGGLALRLAHKTAHTTETDRSVLVTVDPRSTSRTCAVCGHVAKENRTSQAVFSCHACGHQAHADTNAAINILRRAQPPVLAVIEVCGRADRERTASAWPTASRVNPHTFTGSTR